MKPTLVDAGVLAAIARTLERGGGLDGALVELRRLDPVLRGKARRRLRETYADAQLATEVKGADAHVLRLTYLLLMGVAPARGVRDDVDALAAAYAEELRVRPPRKEGFWWLSTMSLGLAVAGIAAIAMFAPAPGGGPKQLASASASVAVDPRPPLRGAFATGGVPEKTPGDAVIARALGTDLPAFLIALDRRTDARRAGDSERTREAESAMNEARAKALAQDVRDALGPELHASLGALVTTAVASAGPDPGTADDALAKAAGKLDDDLAGAGLGFFVDADVITESDGRRRVLVYSFRVARVNVLAAGDTEVRALRVRRIDNLNWSHTLVGFTRPNLRAAVLLLDQLEEQVLTVIAPALADGAPATLFDPDARVDDRSKVEARAGELVREEYGGYPGVDRSAAASLGKLLGARQAIFARWEKLATARNLTLVVPPKLRLPEGFATSLEAWVPASELADLRRIDRSLEDRTREEAFEALRDALAASIEIHEVQHRLDALGPQPPPMPRELEAHVGPLMGEDGKERRGAASARAELSAYLAEVARDTHTPRVCLAMIGRFLFDKRMHGIPESYAALTIFEGLSAAVPTGKPERILVSGKIDQRAVAAVWRALSELPPDALRSEAKKLWEKLFAAPLPELRRVAPPSR